MKLGASLGVSYAMFNTKYGIRILHLTPTLGTYGVQFFPDLFYKAR